MAHYYHKIVSPWKRTEVKSKTVNTEVFSDEYIAMLKDIQWIGTEKIDGMNLNFYYDGNHVQAFGHTDKSAFSPEISAWLKEIITPEFESIFEQLFGEKEAFVSGELIGPKIQSNLYALDSIKFVMFDIYCKSTAGARSGACIARRPQPGNPCVRLRRDVSPSVLQAICRLPSRHGRHNLADKHYLSVSTIKRIIYKVKLCDLVGHNAGKIR